MIRHESDCVGPCPQGCIGSACRYNNALHLYCDRCGEEVDNLYSAGGYEDALCESCAEEEMREIVEDFDFYELCEATGYSEVI